MDIRTGPNLSRAAPLISALCSNPALNAVVSISQNSSRLPTSLHLGNYGRHNFNGGGPSAPPPPPRTSSGCVVSLPGCVSQAIHSDTPHLHDDVQLRPHYLNAFFVTTDEGGHRRGQTAFAVGSQRLEVCKDMTEEGEGGKNYMHLNSTRPHARVGDCVIFDARILHWGTENRDVGGGGDKGWRGIFYVNFWREFFQDPKNWDERETVFTDDDWKGVGEA